MANEVFGYKELFSFHTKDCTSLVAGGSSLVKFGYKIDVVGGSNEALIAANLSSSLVTALLSSSQARGTRISELGQRKGNGASSSYAQILSSSPCVERDTNISMVLPTPEIIMPHAFIIALELSKAKY
ncbi:hypothetical protein PanWU01x14_087730 [Parasponia andersonii]|uniref:Uncharacterized protein n=1 Tax=Parasponia andersonii TaxID=3476 RepID=A0A2P5D8K7_PARAD|nr:hypothetical protein PanWU01x14_087730 [Parasponia andersonii]